MIFKVPTTASCSIVIVVVVTKVVALLTHLNKKPRTAEHDRETTLWGIARIFVTVFKMIVPAFLTTTDAAASISLPSLADRRAFPTADTEKRTRPIPNIERNVERLGLIAYVTVFRSASPDVRCTTSSPTTSVANSME